MLMWYEMPEKVKALEKEKKDPGQGRPEVNFASFGALGCVVRVAGASADCYARGE